MTTQVCTNCGAEGSDFGTGPNGEIVCCAHCIFSPLGCRCRYGEYGIAETDDYSDWDDEEDDLDLDEDDRFDFDYVDNE